MPHRSRRERRSRRLLFLIVCMACIAGVHAPALTADETSASPMRLAIERYAADRGLLERQYDVPLSAERAARLRGFHEEALRSLDAVAFETLDVEGRVDFLLLRTHLRRELAEIDFDAARDHEAARLLPFAAALLRLEEDRHRGTPQDGRASAAALDEAAREVGRTRRALDDDLKAGKGPPKTAAARAAGAADELRKSIGRWNAFYAGYDPELTWWTREPFARLDRELGEHAKLLRQKVVGAIEGEEEPLVGDPIGREALVAALASEWIPYSPEEILAIADRELAWCEQEMKRVADDLGFAGSWRKALDHVNAKHLRPGEQPGLIRELALEAVKFLEDRSLVTIPELCKESWRMEMMPPDRQRLNPYFTGGEVISVSFPTDGMEHQDKLMSLRGNNPSFCRATVHHELIPGHHLQGFMAARHHAHRRVFRTPFLIEGWPLYWEMLLWDLGFARNAEDRAGMLFWRVHRAARIVFSINYHLGKMTADEAVKLLVERVGHERRNAVAEVRRSIAGGYSPLYQAAYMLGGLQLRALRRELVESGRRTERDFHDAVLRENAIPVELIRASLTGQVPARDAAPSWRFYDLPPAAPAGSRTSSADPVGRPPRVYRDRVQPRWIDGERKLWYRVDVRGGGREFVLVDTEAGTRRPAFDHHQVAAALGKALGAEIAAASLPIDDIAVAGDGARLVLKASGRSWSWDPASGELRDAGTSDPASGPNGDGISAPREPRPSRRTGAETEVEIVNAGTGAVAVFWMDPDGKRQSYGTVAPGERRRQHTFAGHVWLLERAGAVVGVFEGTDEQATAVVRDDGVVLSRAAMAGRQRPRRPAARTAAVSPDGKHEAFARDHNLWLRALPSGEEYALTRDGSPDDSYAADAQRDRAVDLDYDGAAPASTATSAYWSPDGKRLVALRRHGAPERRVYLVESTPRDQVQPKLHSYPYHKPGDPLPTEKPRLFDVEARREVPVSDALFANPWSVSHFHWSPDSSRCYFLYNERGHQVARVVAIDAATGEARAVVNEESGTFFAYSSKLFLEHLDATEEVLWMSERDGWNHLYLYDRRTGAVKSQVTRGEWVVRGVDRVDRERRQVWFRAGGVRPGQDPYHVHQARVGLDGTGLTVLTEGDGTHAVSFSPGGQFLVDTWSRTDLPPVAELRRAGDGGLVCVLEEADAGELVASGRRRPERFAAKGRDGDADIYGLIHFPRNFDPTRRYPVVESIYAGPHDSHVPKAFRASYPEETIADLGFVVVEIDGMGTSNRSKAFHDVAWRNLADAGFPDRIAWIRAAAAERPYMDTSRVGIYGGSAGGQNALGALLWHGDFYKVAVADCGCHDNRMDKVWWNEQWMGWPVGPHYAEQSNVTRAHRLSGKLLLVVGELDRNVDPASTMQVVDALVKADKDFDLLIIPGAGHGAAETPYGRRRRADFLVRHLLGKEPRAVRPF